MARRINKRFLIILTLVVMGGTLLAAFAALFVQRMFQSRNASQAMVLGDAAAAKGDWAAVREQYKRAVSASPTNVEAMVKLGDVMYELTATEDPSEMMRGAIGMWEAAVNQNPRCLPALQRLFDKAVELVEVINHDMGTSSIRRNSSPMHWQTVGKRAKALLLADPQNVRAKAYEQIAILGAWLAGEPRMDDLIEPAIQALLDLQPLAPAAVYIPRYVAQARLRLAELHMEKEEWDTATADRKAALTAFVGVDGKQFKTQQDQAPYLYRYYQTIKRVNEGEAAERARQGQPATPAADEEKALLDVAVQVSKPSDSEYIDLQMESVHWMLRKGREDEAEKRLVRLRDEFPYQLPVRLELAAIRNRTGKRADAIAMLDKPLAREMKGYRATLWPRWELSCLIRLAQIRIDHYQETTDAAQCASLRQAIDQNVKQVQQMSQGDWDRYPPVLKLRAGLLLLDDKHLEAIPLMEKALAPYREPGKSAFLRTQQVDRDLVELVRMLAREYRELGMAGMSIDLLGAGRVATGAHDRRARTWRYSSCRSGAMPRRRHLPALEMVFKDSPVVLGLKFDVLMGLGKEDDARALVRSLVENGDPQRMLKGRLALRGRPCPGGKDAGAPEPGGTRRRPGRISRHPVAGAGATGRGAQG